MKTLPRISGFLALAGLAATARAQSEYQFTLVEAFTPSYNLRECYLTDINELGLACGTATREYQVAGGTSIGYSGLTWTDATEKSPLDAILWPRGVNNHGWVVGLRTVFDAGSGSVVATIPYPPGGMSTMEALGVNDAGTVVGYAQTCVCSNSNGLLQIPFVWDAVNGTRAVNVPGAKELRRVNATDVAVGNIRGTGPTAFRYDVASGAYATLSPLLPAGANGPAPSVGADVNDQGTIAGYYTDQTTFVRRGVIWAASGSVVTFASFGGVDADVFAQGINNSGTAVGYAQPGQGAAFHAFVWDAAHGIRDLNSLTAGVPQGFILDRALKVNDRGWIVGDGHYGPGWSTSIAFVLRPAGAACYANCDGSVTAPAVNTGDFTCFLQRYSAAVLLPAAQQQADYANCDGSANFPQVNTGDFTCFLQKYAAGGP